MKHLVPLALLFIFSSVNSVKAQTINNRHFIYDGSITEPHRVKQNPDTPSQRGWNFTFWGKGYGAGCAGTGYVNNGAIKEASGLFDFLGDTGISQGAVGNNFTPSSNSQECNDKSKWGESHSHFNNANNGQSPAGIGIFTSTGPVIWDRSRLGFFQPPSTGIPNVQGHFIGYDCATSCMKGSADPKNVFPFSGTTTNFDKLTLVLSSNQTLRWLHLDDPTVQQTRQQMMFTVVSLSNGAPVQYLFANAFKGIYSHSNLNSASVMEDPIQGGLSYVDGPLGANGQATNYIASNGQAYALWNSWGSPTEYNSSWLGSRNFQVEITFNQFLTVLRLATSHVLNKNPDLVTDAEIAQRFGENYRMPLNWVLSGVAVAHESYNPIWQTSSTVTGGGFSSLKVLSLPY